jgi:hypothetical protein
MAEVYWKAVALGDRPKHFFYAGKVEPFRSANMVVIELPDEQAAALKAKAAAQGLTLTAWLAKLAEAEPPVVAPQKPFKTGRGMWAKYGPAPSAEDIEENRRDMFRGFAEDFE